MRKSAPGSSGPTGRANGPDRLTRRGQAVGSEDSRSAQLPDNSPVSGVLYGRAIAEPA